jgi:hypothetical protein
MKLQTAQRYRLIINEISGLSWADLTREDLTAVAWAYYYFSVQFRENLEIACDLNPWDERLRDLRTGRARRKDEPR